MSKENFVLGTFAVVLFVFILPPVVMLILAVIFGVKFDLDRILAATASFLFGVTISRGLSRFDNDSGDSNA